MSLIKYFPHNHRYKKGIMADFFFIISLSVYGNLGFESKMIHLDVGRKKVEQVLSGCQKNIMRKNKLFLKNKDICL